MSESNKSQDPTSQDRLDIQPQRLLFPGAFWRSKTFV